MLTKLYENKYGSKPQETPKADKSGAAPGASTNLFSKPPNNDDAISDDYDDDFDDPVEDKKMAEKSLEKAKKDDDDEDDYDWGDLEDNDDKNTKNAAQNKVGGESSTADKKR